MKCKKCGHENKRGAKFCDDCGVSLLGGVCPECGHKNRTDAQFCEKCGANIAGGLQKGAIPVEPKEKPGLSPVMRIIIGIIGIITFLGGGYRMLKALDFQLPEFFSKASSSDEAPSTEDSDVVRVAYTTNPATNVDEGKPIEMVFNWGAETEGQVQDFIDNAVLELSVNGTPLAARITFDKISSDESTGGFSTQVIAEIGKLPPGTNKVVLTITWKQKITDGKDSFGPSTDNEQVQKEARIIVNPPAGAQQAAKEPDFTNCPPDNDISSGDVLWDESTGDVRLEIRNKQGWEEWNEGDEIPSLPAYFAEEEGVGDQGDCIVDTDDNTLVVCYATLDHKPSRMQLHAPYKWSATPAGYCVMWGMDLPVVDAVQCPPMEKLSAGELFWDAGKASLRIYNTLGWEPYQEDPEYLSILTVYDDLYTELGCEVIEDNDTIMLCNGPGSVKTGGVGLELYFPWEGTLCRFYLSDVEIMGCPTGSSLCVFTGACCPDTNECNVSGCIAPKPPPSSDDDHYH